ncbi:MAG: hypothetical protein WCF08_02015 [Anaerolineaceae bacterium]
MESILRELLKSNEPSIRYKTLTGIYGLSESHPEVRNAREAIRTCERVKALLKHRNRKGEIDTHPYKKWQGAHWTLSMLAELGYPAGDTSLIPLREQVLNWLFSSNHDEYIHIINGRVRICASMTGNALLTLLKLELADERIDKLVNRLVEWQWPDGGWNCDKHPEASHSSFMESLLPIRGLIQYSQDRNPQPATTSIHRAAELFLSHELFKRTSDGTPILKEFLWLRCPRHWHNDILGGLTAIESAGNLKDPRCHSALSKLKDMMLPAGGYCANGRYYQMRQPNKSQFSPVDWGPVRKGKMNEFITVEALTILIKSGLLPLPDQRDLI